MEHEGSEDMEEAGRLVGQAREARGWTQEELAEEAGLTRQTVARVESGDPKVSRKTLRLLARAFGHSEWQAFRERGPAPPALARVTEIAPGENPVETRRLIGDPVGQSLDSPGDMRSTFPGAAGAWRLVRGARAGTHPSRAALLGETGHTESETLLERPLIASDAARLGDRGFWVEIVDHPDLAAVWEEAQEGYIAWCNPDREVEDNILVAVLRPARGLRIQVLRIRGESLFLSETGEAGDEEVPCRREDILAPVVFTTAPARQPRRKRARENARNG